MKDVVRDTLKHPLKLLPTVVLTVIWILFSLLGTLGNGNPVVRLINTLTYSNGGMYGGILGAVGGILGKAFFAAIVTSLVNSLISKKAKTGKTGKAGLKGASVGALKTVAPFLIGAGAGLMLYCFFNITSTPKNIMVAVAGAAAAIISIVSGHGFFFSIITRIINVFANGKVPSVTLVRHALGGFAAGFAVAVPVTFARKPLLIAIFGAVLLIAGIL
ncbi:MAG: hypothetical protein II738_06210, partial [Clostridia bacterium]|nr:hypothetical protein [Clostridia bacterium]